MYDLIVGKIPKKWSSIVMKNIATPRAVFIMWIALWGRLSNKDRLRKFGIVVDDRCVIMLRHLNICCWNVNIPERF